MRAMATSSTKTPTTAPATAAMGEEGADAAKLKYEFFHRFLKKLAI